MEIDPERIEAHKNEDPPPYEPTDVESQPEESEEQNVENEDVPVGEAENYSGETGLEVVYEDAREERQAEAAAATAAAEAAAASTITAEADESEGQSHKRRQSPYRPNKKARKKTVSAAEKATTAVQQPLWPAVSEFDDRADGGDGSGDNEDSNMGEPSMEEFFENQMVDVGTEADITVEGTNTEKESTSKDMFSPSAVLADPDKDSGQVSLVPKNKRSTRKRRPKIRPALRKKKTK